MTLEAAIGQLIDLGEKDPLLIARKIEQQQGREWLAGQLAAYAEQLVAEIARQRLGALRRSAQVALRPGDSVAQGELRIRSFWIPGEGWKRAADVTPDDLFARADWNERFAGAVLAQARWCRDVGQLLLDAGAATLGKFRGELPALPDAQGALVA